VEPARPRIAIVDDEASVRVALERLLRLAEYQVVGFGSGEAFLASIADTAPDCAVVDIHMPGLGGLAIRSRLAVTHVDLPVVFITASDDPSLDVEARAAGGEQLLRKPFAGDELLRAIAAALNAHGKSTG
jgi:FixJ family two-component response regulator